MSNWLGFAHVQQTHWAHLRSRALPRALQGPPWARWMPRPPSFSNGPKLVLGCGGRGCGCYFLAPQRMRHPPLTLLSSKSLHLASGSRDRVSVHRGHQTPGPVVTMVTTRWRPGVGLSHCDAASVPTNARLTGAPSPGAWPTPRSPACYTPFLSSTSQQPAPGGPGEGVWHLGWWVLCREGHLAPHRHLAVGLAFTHLVPCPISCPCYSGNC